MLSTIDLPDPEDVNLVLGSVPIVFCAPVMAFATTNAMPAGPVKTTPMDVISELATAVPSIVIRSMSSCVSSNALVNACVSPREVSSSHPLTLPMKVLIASRADSTNSLTAICASSQAFIISAFKPSVVSSSCSFVLVMRSLAALVPSRLNVSIDRCAAANAPRVVVGSVMPRRENGSSRCAYARSPRMRMSSPNSPNMRCASAMPLRSSVLSA